MEPAQLEFLLRTAVLEPMCAPLCDAVLERTTPRRCSSGWSARTCSSSPSTTSAAGSATTICSGRCSRRSSSGASPSSPRLSVAERPSWCVANGQPGASRSSTLTAAGDTDELARLVSALAFPYYRSGRVTTFERWLAMFDDPDAARTVSRDRGARGLDATRCAAGRKPPSVGRWRSKPPESEDPMPDGSPLEAWAATVRALLCRRGVEQMQIDAELALSHLPDTSPWYPVSVLLRGMAVLFSGDLDRAEAILDRGCGRGRRRRSDLGRRRGALRAGAPRAGARRSRRGRVGARPRRRVRRGRLRRRTMS